MMHHKANAYTESNAVAILDAERNKSKEEV